MITTNEVKKIWRTILWELNEIVNMSYQILTYCLKSGCDCREERKSLFYSLEE